MVSAVTLRAATDADRPVIERLLQLYLHDMTEFLPFPVGGDGAFQYGYLDRFWRHPYLIEVAGELAGFALVIDECPVTETPDVWFMAEFFVLRAHRGRGVGRAAFEAIVKQHSGPWHVAVIDRNLAAAGFWRTALPDADSRPVHFDGEHWTVRSFSV